MKATCLYSVKSLCFIYPFALDWVCALHCGIYKASSFLIFYVFTTALGDTCTENSDCSFMTNAECQAVGIGSLCLCVAGYEGTIGGTECIIKG